MKVLDLMAVIKGNGGPQVGLFRAILMCVSLHVFPSAFSTAKHRGGNTLPSGFDFLKNAGEHFFPRGLFFFRSEGPRQVLKTLACHRKDRRIIDLGRASSAFFLLFLFHLLLLDEKQDEAEIHGRTVAGSSLPLDLTDWMAAWSPRPTVRQKQGKN